MTSFFLLSVLQDEYLKKKNFHLLGYSLKEIEFFFTAPLTLFFGILLDKKYPLEIPKKSLDSLSILLITF